MTSSAAPISSALTPLGTAAMAAGNDLRDRGHARAGMAFLRLGEMFDRLAMHAEGESPERVAETVQRIGAAVGAIAATIEALPAEPTEKPARDLSPDFSAKVGAILIAGAESVAGGHREKAEPTEKTVNGKKTRTAAGWRAVVSAPPSHFDDVAVIVTQIAGHLLRREVDPHIVLVLMVAWVRCMAGEALADSAVEQAVEDAAAAEIARRRGLEVLQ